VRARTALINTARGLTKSYGERLRGCSQGKRNRELALGLSPELRSALQPLLDEIESLSERIRGYNERVQEIAHENYSEVARLEQVKGVGTWIALIYVLTLEDPQRFRKSRDVGCYRGPTTGAQELGTERGATAHQQGRRPPSENSDDAKCTPHSESCGARQ
jgi:transposase